MDLMPNPWKHFYCAGCAWGGGRVLVYRCDQLEYRQRSSTVVLDFFLRNQLLMGNRFYAVMIEFFLSKYKSSLVSMVQRAGPGIIAIQSDQALPESCLLGLTVQFSSHRYALKGARKDDAVLPKIPLWLKASTWQTYPAK